MYLHKYKNIFIQLPSANPPPGHYWLLVVRCLVGSLVGRFVGLVAWLGALLVDWFGWFVGWVVGWVVGWLDGWLAGRLAVWFVLSSSVHTNMLCG